MSAIYKKRFEVYFLTKHPEGPKWTVAKTAKYLGVSRHYVTRWSERCKATGNVDDEPGRGLTRATSKQQDKKIVSLFVKNPTLTLRQAKKNLGASGIDVSLNTIRQRLKENNVLYRSTIKKPLLNEHHLKKRLQWAQENICRDWSNVIFTDESSFWLHTPIKRVWSTQHNRLVQRTIKHPAKVHVYGCFSAQGFGRLICFTQNLDKMFMLKLYKIGLLKSAEKWYGPNNMKWVLQEDNDPKHRSRLCTQWKEENCITTLDWPSQSPDANPIENVWAIMKSKLAGKKYMTAKQLTAALKQIWKSFSPEYAKQLVDSCSRRCQQIIDNKGDWTVY